MGSWCPHTFGSLLNLPVSCSQIHPVTSSIGYFVNLNHKCLSGISQVSESHIECSKKKSDIHDFRVIFYPKWIVTLESSSSPGNLSDKKCLKMIWLWFLSKTLGKWNYEFIGFSVLETALIPHFPPFYKMSPAYKKTKSC